MEPSEIFLSNLDHLGCWGVITTDVDLRITGWNRWLEQRSGKSASDVFGHSLLELYPDLIVRGMDKYYRQVLEGRGAILSQRFHKYLLPMPPTVSATNLMHMQQTARLTPLLDHDVVRGTLTLIEDVTERIATEDELRRQAERLEEANRHKDEFLAMLAHELRNPLGPIRNGIHVLDFVPSDSPEARQTREMMERQVAHMARLVDDLLDVSRIARGKVRLRREPCDLKAIVRDVMEDYRPLIEAGGIRLRVEISPAACDVLGDGVRLAQVIGNVLHNAQKFTNAGGEIRVTCDADGRTNFALIRISDTGIGMSRQTLVRVFEAFTQAENSLDRSKGGLGLGLSLAKGLANLHGGSIEAESKGLGQGSTFTLRFPLIETEAASVPTTPRPGAQSERVRRILVIEDNRDMARTMKMLLTHFGYEVETAATGTAGIELAIQFRPTVVLCDIGLPGLDGYAVARALRTDSATQDSYLIAQSGYGQDEDLRKAHEAGFDLHLTKPVDFTELNRILASIPT